jgi:hypothetical protein
MSYPYIDRSLAGGLHPRREQWRYARITTPGLGAALA